MAQSIFLDSARMGQPTSVAVKMQYALARFWAQEGLSVHSETLLHDGWQALPPGLQRVSSGLSKWRGVNELKDKLRDLAGVGAGWHVLFANRSAKLFELSQQLCRRTCRRVLFPSLLWPDYARKCLSSGPFHCAKIDDNFDDVSLAEQIAANYARNHCDGLLLPSVTHLGACLPIAQVVAAIAAVGAPIKLLVIDGAQEFGHTPLTLREDIPTIYITSSQKWLGSGCPMGIALASPSNCLAVVDDLVQQTDDSLLRFSSLASSDYYGETVAVQPMFATRAAIHRLSRSRVVYDFHKRQCNLVRLRPRLAAWQLANPFASFGGILSLRMPIRQILPHREIRADFDARGLILSTFPPDVVRLSLPAIDLTCDQLDRISQAFQVAAFQVAP